MEYYKLLHLVREPFSNSPDPGLFYNSRQHLEALQQLEISIRLKRGLNVLTGDVGTGKTTLSRQIIQKFSGDDSIITAFVLDPGFNTVEDFLSYILYLFNGDDPYRPASETNLKERLKNFLFTQSVDKNKIVVLMIDEGQKLSIECLEVLRELLNYETNEHKLLQIVIFAQNEFDLTINRLDNFNDRINFKYNLGPLNFKDTQGLINYRLEQSFEPGREITIFSRAACWALFRATGGYPRKIIKLCHHVILTLIIKNKKRAGYFFIRACINRQHPKPFVRRVLVPLVMIIITGFSALAYYRYQKMPVLSGTDTKTEITTAQEPVPSMSLSEANASVPDVLDKDDHLILSSDNEILVDPGKDANDFSDLVMESSKTDVRLERKVRIGKTKQRPPVWLGSLTLSNEDTLEELATVLYGTDIKNVLDDIIRSNPGIDLSKPYLNGLSIRCPVPSFFESAALHDSVAIVLAKETDIKLAYQFVRQCLRGDFSLNAPSDWQTDKGPVSRYSECIPIPVRILPCWNLNQGLLFKVIIDKTFDNLENALEYKKMLPGGLTGSCEKISSWNKGTLIYAKRM